MKLVSHNNVLLFPVKVHKFSIENFDQQKFAKFATRLQHICQSQLRSGTGWQSPSDIHDINKYFKDNEDIDCMTELLKIISWGLPEIEKYYKFKKLNLDLEARIISLWVNINYPGAHNKMHNHGTAGFSGTLYIQKDEDQGEIVFEDVRRESKLWVVPKTKTSDVPTDSQWISENIFGYQEIETKTGDIILLPSWLDHMVGINKTQDPRISVSFNFNWYEK
tara:strand:- start:996 stop:1658 length:663 start_codon:yes stop_codon:yes gene_type:complete